ncbi:coenzyme F420-0:L-glutamate ligase [Luteimicrobium subarcticum]|uniref:Coenzyme F420-0:L-glutamate ligase/coenzyme F420-1:gamma-L-glutamate ligase n=1 Tax=Luteimicrobium subarcticum TaxID=620910 RepID=A0A2M8WU86_9MICO|nr:coenzyme F420-0:L-glutamate ligase [Luteimicrobium subarcticum]PJI94468.1 coenzyme F420-0:L-glutamate ligase/coenzyme F420-1:gamma-L-glutamate ligase [Luteimicrobium subarcticum]
MSQMLQVWSVDGIGEVAPGDDLAAIVVRSLTGPAGTSLEDGDVVVVASKVVSKAEGRVVRGDDREAAITAETVRVVATRETDGKTLRIVENKLGLVMAAAGVDASNTPEGTVLLLPEDPDASARALRARIAEATGRTVGVVVSDTVGRPWRSGVTDIAIGAAGVVVLDDLRGRPDASGRVLTGTVVAVADQLAAATELVRGKADAAPVAVVRGAAHWVSAEDGPGARSAVRPSDEDMFRTGSTEAYDAGYDAGYDDAVDETRDPAYRAGYEQGFADGEAQAESAEMV